MTEQSMLHVIDGERLTQQRIVPQVDHADREVVARAPPRVYLSHFLCAQRSSWALRLRGGGIGGHGNVSSKISKMRAARGAGS
jgi:hypothetical protein